MHLEIILMSLLKMPVNRIAFRHHWRQKEEWRGWASAPALAFRLSEGVTQANLRGSDGNAFTATPATLDRLVRKGFLQKRVLMVSSSAVAPPEPVAYYRMNGDDGSETFAGGRTFPPKQGHLPEGITPHASLFCVGYAVRWQGVSLGRFAALADAKRRLLTHQQKKSGTIPPAPRRLAYAD